jgi:hypothetical protein
MIKATANFSYAQLNVFYTSIALEWRICHSFYYFFVISWAIVGEFIEIREKMEAKLLWYY